MMFKSSKNKDAAWELMKFLSSDEIQTEYAELLGHVPVAARSPSRRSPSKEPNYEAFYKAIQQGRTYAPIPQWAQIENAYKARFGNILDAAGGLGGELVQPEAVTEELERGGRRRPTRSWPRAPADGLRQVSAPLPLTSPRPAEPAAAPTAGPRREADARRAAGAAAASPTG